jgi:hypothetical protein
MGGRKNPRNVDKPYKVRRHKREKAVLGDFDEFEL